MNDDHKIKGLSGRRMMPPYRANCKFSEWEASDPHQILKDLENGIAALKTPKKEETYIVVVGNPGMDPKNKEILFNCINELNKNNAVTFTHKDRDDLIVSPDHIIIFKEAEDFHKPLMENFPEKDTGKSRNFKERPSVPSNKRKWKK